MKNVTVEQLERWAFTDDLTGISNRRHLGLVREQRAELDQTTYYVAIDLDGFKRAQDQPGRGHPWGDRLLRRFARHLLQSTRQVRQIERRGRRTRKLLTAGRADVVVGRPGGDEFLVIAPSEAGASKIAERVRAWAAHGVTATAAVGPTWAAADRALYGLKRLRNGSRTARRAA